MNDPDTHRDFYGLPPVESVPDPAQLNAKRIADERQRLRNTVTRVFLGDPIAGKECLDTLRKMASYIPRVDLLNSKPDHLNTFLIARTARQELVAEIEAMCEKEIG